MGRSEHFAAGASETFRNVTPASPEQYGVKFIDRTDTPLTVQAHQHLLNVNNDKHSRMWTGTKVETITPSTPVKTSQDQVGVEHVENYAKRLKAGATGAVDFREKGAHPDDQDDGRPRLLRHAGELYHVDGLHRLAAARSKGRSVKARVYDLDAHVAKPSYGPTPAHHEGLVDHLSEDHIDDNEFVDEDTEWHPHEVRDYHAELHATGVADHRHD